MKRLLTLFTASYLLVAPLLLPAQCAMCKSNVEAAQNDPRNTNKVGAGLNNGILYLLAVPYVAVTIVGIAWYRHRRRQAAQQVS